jgi:hypothetical protein
VRALARAAQYAGACTRSLKRAAPVAGSSSGCDARGTRRGCGSRLKARADPAARAFNYAARGAKRERASRTRGVARFLRHGALSNAWKRAA